VATIELIDRILDIAVPLEGPRATRLPLLLWPLTDVESDDPAVIRRCLRDLDARGLTLISSWDHEAPGSLERSLGVGRIARELGLQVVVNANRLLHRFCNGDARTAHLDERGLPFFDTSFDPRVPIGCPFALGFRYPEIRDRVARFADAYARESIRPDLVFADWEIDGPIEWNGAWEAARRCRRCREHVPSVDDFAAFQGEVRSVRAEMQRATYSGVLEERFPGVLVGNYAVHPHDGWRYWYDWFERLPPGAPFRADQRAKYRSWVPEFAAAGYTVAMPVLYTWYPTFSWYDFADPDYRWFYNMLLEATGAGRHTPRGVPVVPFVHWHTTSPPPEPDPAVRQMSAAAYQELLWPALLRGASTLFLWCRPNETEEEVRLVHGVFRDAQTWGRFFGEGTPVLFDVPAAAGAVVSARRLGDELLVRRTDFGEDRGGDIEVEAADCASFRLGPPTGLCRTIRAPRLATGHRPS